MTAKMNAAQDDVLEYVIHQSQISLGRHQPLTVRAIINHLSRQKAAKLSDKERAYLTDFSADEDQGALIDETFLDSAMELGKEVRSKRFQYNGEAAGWFGIHRFLGLYVINHTQYGEGQEMYGPFGTRKEADEAFSCVVALNTP